MLSPSLQQHHPANPVRRNGPTAEQPTRRLRQSRMSEETPSAPPAAPPAAPPSQPRNPLHGIRLEDMLNALVATYGWPGLADRIPVRCFAVDPSISSSLKFLRRTPWARDKVEGLYLFMLREQRRNGY